jgi:alginate O-acetyltransferase complex protein AlgJ
VLSVGCHAGGAKFPWGDAKQAPVVEHVQVRTLNPDYQRTRSQVWVRAIAWPTRAALDYAAYHANFMIADPEPETPFATDKQPDTTHPFAGKIESSSLTSDFAKTPLSAEERRLPLAFAPLSEFLQAHKVSGATALAEVGAAVHDEKWGLALPPGSAGQSLSELYVHTPASGPAELWAKIEFQPWFKPVSTSSDQDGDGFPEIYGRVQSGVVSKGLLDAIEKDYRAPLLSPKEVKAWANQLSSYWYPSFNTDLMPVGPSFPDDRTEANIKSELGGMSFERPTIVLRGKPQGKPTYNVFVIAGAGESGVTPANPSLNLSKTRPTPKPEPVGRAVALELSNQGGGSWSKWAAQVAPFRDAVRRRLKAMPRGSKALAGKDGFLFYKNGLEYLAGGDLEAQRKGKNPLPIIVEFKQELDKQGVDFLFVPVPTKEEIYPEQLAPDIQVPAGQVVNPFFRKFLASLSKEGIEVVDLLPTFLAQKSLAANANGQALFQHQDTHWTDRGLRLAAELLSSRIKAYPWYAELSKHSQPFSLRETSFTRFGDLQSRLPETQQKKYTPETLLAQQVLRADKQPYDDDPDSPIVLLGDSFAGVYELTDAEHAGVSAHIARGISYPLDLVMSYGGGPNVRQKLLRRGEAALGTKKLVIWLMTARDLFNYWEEWEPLNKP